MNVLVVGSCLIDLFTHLVDESIAQFSHNRVSFELGDKVPIDIKGLTLGGNGGNVAAGLKKLGASVSFYTYLGHDVLSHHIEETLRDEGVKLTVEHGNVDVGSMSFILNFPQDRVIFSHHNYRKHGFDPSEIKEKPDCIYLTSIGNEWENAYKGVLAYSKKQNIPLAFSPGSHQIRDLNEIAVEVLRSSKMLFCNLREAKLLLSAVGKEAQEPKEIIEEFKNIGIDVISITHGKNGSYAKGQDNLLYKINVMPGNGEEKTGAGDAYASGFLASYLNGKNIPESMKSGALNASSVMTKVGAQSGLLDAQGLNDKLSEYKNLEIQTL